MATEDRREKEGDGGQGDVQRPALGSLALVAFTGVVLSIITFETLRTRIADHEAAEFALRADGDALHLERFAEKHFLAVRSLQGLFEASEEVTLDEFQSFSQNLRSYAPATLVLAWCPAVHSSERTAFEAGGALPPGRTIWELGEGDAPRPASEREEHYPAALVDPLHEYASDIGFDLGSEPRRLDALRRARDTGLVVATPCLPLQRVGAMPREGTVVMAAVYSSRDPATPEERRAAFQGVAVAVVPIDALIDQALSPFPSARFDLAVIGAGPDGDRVVHTYSSRPGAADEVTLDAVRAGDHLERDLSIADRTWRLVFRRSAATGPQTLMPWIILVLGVLLTAIVVTYAYTLLTRQVAVTTLAEGRAVQLVSARESLERARAERRQAERLLLDAVDRINQGIALFDADDRILFFNRHYTGSFQLSGTGLLAGVMFEEIVRDQVSRGLIEDALGREEEWLAWRMEHHRDPSDPIEVRRHSGKIFRISEHRLPDGATFSVVTDITRERRSEEQLRQSQRMEGIGQLTGGVAHDFNNLLTVIMGNLDLLEDAIGSDEDLGDLARDANQAARRGAELTQRLLAFARRQPLVPTVTDVNRLVEQMSSLLERTLGEAVRLDTKLAASAWPTLVDAAQLETALLNLAVNARDAMPNGGELVIETSNAVREGALTDDDAGGEFAEIAVSDNGVGMPRQVLERAFEPFFTTKGVGKGSGLGLSMVYGFVKQSGGHIEIDSTPTRGTTVRLLLPRCEHGAPLPVAPPIVEHEPPGHGERVVLVEDDVELRDLVERTLTTLGYVVVAAPHGPEALSMTNGEEPPDLLLTDVVLPEGVNGIELAAQFRERYADLPVLFMSGYSDAKELRDGELGRLLTKPFRREELARVVREVLDTE